MQYYKRVTGLNNRFKACRPAETNGLGTFWLYSANLFAFNILHLTFIYFLLQCLNTKEVVPQVLESGGKPALFFFLFLFTFFMQKMWKRFFLCGNRQGIPLLRPSKAYISHFSIHVNIFDNNIVRWRHMKLIIWIPSFFVPTRILHD